MQNNLDARGRFVLGQSEHGKTDVALERVKVGMGISGDHAIKDERRNDEHQKAQDIGNGGANRIDERTCLGLRDFVFVFDHVTDEVIEDRAIFPVIVVRFSWEDVAREPEVVFFLELEWPAFTLLQPGPCGIEFEPDRITIIVVIAPLDARVLTEMFAGRREIEGAEKGRPKQNVFVDRRANREIAAHIPEPRRDAANPVQHRTAFRICG